MLQVHHLQLLHFKNYTQGDFHFPARIICIHGANGCGKTTILDAIHYLCFTKSYFQHLDSAIITHGKHGMRLDARFENQTSHLVTCIIRENGRKEFLIDESPYVGFSQHIGKFPCVFIAPDDINLIMEGSETRRKFLDAMMSQTNAAYMQHLILYNRYLQQRNSLLKQWAEGGVKDFSLLAVYNKQLHEIGTRVFEEREHYCTKFKTKVKQIYALLTEAKEEIDLYYSSQLQREPLLDLLEKHSDRDILTQRTNFGIHKDDLVFNLQGMPMKQVASQGQRKSFLFALKLAQFEMVHELTGKFPLLLLDDIFEKLDEQRSRQLITYIKRSESQVFITDTHEERLQEAFRDMEDVHFLKLD